MKIDARFSWISLKRTIEYLGEQEMLYNSHFNRIEFDTIREEKEAWAEMMIERFMRYGCIK